MIGRPYDGRETDAWACGIVLYALVTRRLPFDAMNPTPDSAVTSDVHGESKKVRGPRKDERSERRALLMRIAKGEYSWPELPFDPEKDTESDSLKGQFLARSEGVRRIVGRLLVRDPRKRSKVAQLWEDDWLSGQGAPPAPLLPDNGPSEDVAQGAPGSTESSTLASSVTHAWDNVSDGSDDMWDADLDDDEGVLVDDQDIGPGSVARQELMP